MCAVCVCCVCVLCVGVPVNQMVQPRNLTSTPRISARLERVTWCLTAVMWVALFSVDMVGWFVNVGGKWSEYWPRQMFQQHTKKINCKRGEDWRSNTGPVIPSLHGALQSSCFAPCRHALPRSHAIHPSQLKRHVSWLGGLTLSSVHKGGGREMHALHWRRLKKKASKNRGLLFGFCGCCCCCCCDAPDSFLFSLEAILWWFCHPIFALFEDSHPVLLTLQKTHLSCQERKAKNKTQVVKHQTTRETDTHTHTHTQID